MTTDVLRLALEALEYASTGNRRPELITPAIIALRQVIDQAEQAQPVAWRAPNWGQGDDEWVYRDFGDPVLIADGKPSPNNEPLYTAPPPRPATELRKPLTDEEMWKLWNAQGDDFMEQQAAIAFARAIEAAHGIKD